MSCQGCGEMDRHCCHCRTCMSYPCTCSNLEMRKALLTEAKWFLEDAMHRAELALANYEIALKKASKQ